MNKWIFKKSDSLQMSRQNNSLQLKMTRKNPWVQNLQRRSGTTDKGYISVPDMTYRNEEMTGF